MDIEQLKGELDECGFVIIPNLISTAEANRMAKRLMEIMGRQADADKLVQNQRAVFNHDDQDIFVPLVTNPVYLELARHLLGPDFQLAEVGGLWIKPGARAPSFHADVPVGWFPQSGLPVPDACFIVNSLWMLTDFSRENGATQLIPYTHHSRRVPRPNVDYKQHRLSAEGPCRLRGHLSWQYLASRRGQRYAEQTTRGVVDSLSRPLDGPGGRRMELDEA